MFSKDPALQDSLDAWNRRIAAHPGTMTVPDIRDEIMHMRKTERLYRDTLIRIRKGGFVLKLTRVVAVATASAGLPGIIADRKIGWSVSILGFIGMTVNEWAVRR